MASDVTFGRKRAGRGGKASNDLVTTALKEKHEPPRTSIFATVLVTLLTAACAVLALASFRYDEELINIVLPRCKCTGC